ncbi:MAG TPA: ATP-dependent DNA helicase RecG [Candidatus Stercoripulliclostridium merdipullorum]|uniref:ATP-dependent DNA helicase RecG n=1 Tax=Candidatus Stercoripulliclostridium merdipullorum TaxID=2840952 RepID=A0A9D1NAR0_9FIRM|nr:ATP-dependent DNA helicase RecG [Candidatus Stercoripulliclostridium merdipullorum]
MAKQREGLAALKGVGPVTLLKLNKLGIASPEDLLRFLPKTYIDLDAVSLPSEAEEGAFVLFVLRLTSVSKPFRKGKLQLFRAVGTADDGKKVKLSFYNANYVAKQLTVGARVRCYGKLRTEKGYELINPAYEVSDGDKTQFRGIKAIYPTRGYLPQATFAAMIEDALQKGFLSDSMIPEVLCLKHGTMPWKDAVIAAHRPQSTADIVPARNRVLLETIVTDILAYRLLKAHSKRDFVYPADRATRDRLIAALPFRLTQSQTEAVDGIRAILASERPLNAMLTGDVGSGKTAVALVIAGCVALAGRQVAVMAPTEILAKQHLKIFAESLTKAGVSTAFLSGSTPAKEKKEILSRLSQGEIDVLIGTHAVLSKGVNFSDLGLMIVDEQHRFGVGQRTRLIEKGKEVDVLTLSATPIPRSLRLTMFGDIDIFGIERRHAADNIHTAIVSRAKKEEMIAYVADAARKGAKVFVVAPRITDDEAIEGSSVERIVPEWSKISDLSVVALHGKMTPKQKDDAIERFRSGAASVLISTTVIEVGLDVPDASLMIIYDAERFGLASLHQLRGRIGRNGSEAYCFLYTEKDNPEELIRLQTLVTERDGIAIAERDYELRGAGEWMGESQSGHGESGLTIALMKQAKSIADEIDVAALQERLEPYARKLTSISLT